MGRIVLSREVLGTLAILAIVVVSALSFLDADYVRRIGALLSALGATLVIAQVYFEIRSDETIEEKGSSLSAMTPANREDAEAMLAKLARFAKERRLRIVLCVAIVLVVGELLDGWGDLLARTLNG